MRPTSQLIKQKIVDQIKTPANVGFFCLWLSMTQIKAERLVRSRQYELLKRCSMWVGGHS